MEDFAHARFTPGPNSPGYPADKAELVDDGYCDHDCDEECDPCRHQHCIACGDCGCAGYCDDYQTYNLRPAETGGAFDE